VWTVDELSAAPERLTVQSFPAPATRRRWEEERGGARTTNEEEFRLMDKPLDDDHERARQSRVL